MVLTAKNPRNCRKGRKHCHCTGTAFIFINSAFFFTVQFVSWFTIVRGVCMKKVRTSFFMFVETRKTRIILNSGSPNGTQVPPSSGELHTTTEFFKNHFHQIVTMLKREKKGYTLASRVDRWWQSSSSLGGGRACDDEMQRCSLSAHSPYYLYYAKLLNTYLHASRVEYNKT